MHTGGGSRGVGGLREVRGEDGLRIGPPGKFSKKLDNKITIKIIKTKKAPLLSPPLLCSSMSIKQILNFQVHT
jgi:hypothetical protein